MVLGDEIYHTRGWSWSYSAGWERGEWCQQELGRISELSEVQSKSQISVGKWSAKQTPKIEAPSYGMCMGYVRVKENTDTTPGTLIRHDNTKEQ